jgi:hypothetical protein
VNFGKKENMRSNTVIFVYWKHTNRIEHFVNLGKLYTYYGNDELGISRSALNKKDLFDGYDNDAIKILKSTIK